MGRKLRLFMSAFAIVLGVSFVAGSFIFTDTLARAFGGIVEGSVGDVVVRPAGTDLEVQSARTIPDTLIDDLAAVDVHRHAVEHRSRAEPHGDVTDVEHRHHPAPRRRPARRR